MIELMFALYPGPKKHLADSPMQHLAADARSISKPQEVWSCISPTAMFSSPCSQKTFPFTLLADTQPPKPPHNECIPLCPGGQRQGSRHIKAAVLESLDVSWCTATRWNTGSAGNQPHPAAWHRTNGEQPPWPFTGPTPRSSGRRSPSCPPYTDHLRLVQPKALSMGKVNTTNQGWLHWLMYLQYYHTREDDDLNLKENRSET